MVGLQGLFVDRFGVDDGEFAGGRGEDAEVSGDADVVAEAAEAVGDHAVASLAVFEWFDHAVFGGLPADPVVGFDG